MLTEGRTNRSMRPLEASQAFKGRGLRDWSA